MKRIWIGMFAWCAAGLAGAGELPADLGQRLAQGYVSGAMQRFEQSAGQLARDLGAWCARPDDAGRERVRSGFAATVESWSGIEFLRFGPLVAANRFERIFFWPDPRGVTLRQVQALLSGPAGEAGDPQALARRSVAVQGLPALEYVLYREGGLLADMRGKSFAADCAYASAVGVNLAERGGELAEAWKPGGVYAALFAQPAADNPVYRSQREVASEAVKAMSTGLQHLRDVKLAPVIGDEPDASRERRAPFWRSGLTTRAMRASVDGIRVFYQAGGYRYGPSETWIGGNLESELSRAESLLAGMREPVGKMLADAEGYRQLQLASLMLGNIKRIVDEDMAPAFGVTIGFNALDGD